MLFGQLSESLLRLRALLFQGPSQSLCLMTFLAFPLQFLPQRTLCPFRQLQASPQFRVLRHVHLEVREGFPQHVHRSFLDHFRCIFPRSFRLSGSTAATCRYLPLVFPPVAQGVQAVHGDNVPLVYAFFFLTCYEGTVEYVVADRPCGNTQSFRRNVGVHPSGTSLEPSLVLPLVHAGMVAAPSRECEATFWGSRGLLR